MPQIRRTSEERVFRFPYPDNYGVVATDRGLAITGRGMSGFWFIRQAELQKAVIARDALQVEKAPTGQ